MKLLQKFLITVGVLAIIFVVIFTTINILNKKEIEKVSETIDTAFTALKNYDLESLGKIMNTESIESSAKNVLKNTNNSEATAAEKAIFSSLTYEYTVPEDLTIFDEEIIVNLKLANKNMGEVLLKYLKDAVTFSFTNAFSTNKLEESKLNQKMEQILVDAINSDDITMTESDVTLKLIKQENEWKIEFVDEEQFINAILPSFKETLTKYLTQN